MTAQRKRPPRLLGTALSGAVVAGFASVIGYVASDHVPHVLFAGVLKYAIGLLGIVWLFSLNVYNKLSDVTDMPGLDYRQHRDIEVEIRTRLSWFWIRALFLGLVAVLLFAPSLLTEAKMCIPAWLFGAAGAALALALFSLRRLWNELEEIRELRSRVKELERREAERTAQLKSLKEGTRAGWSADDRLDGFRNAPAER